MKCMHMISRDGDHSEVWGRGQLPFGTFPKIRFGTLTRALDWNDY